MNLHEFSEELCATNLNDNNDGPYDHESWVGEDTIKDVNLVVDLSWADHVEDLHEDKEVENNSQVPWISNVAEFLVNWHLFLILYHT